MKIDIVVTQYEAGGAQKAAINLANMLVERGYTPRLIFLYKRFDADLGMKDTVKVVFIQGDVSRLKKIFFTPFKLRKLWKKNAPNVVISFTHYANIISAICAKYLSIPIVASHRNPRSAYSFFTRLIDNVLYKNQFYTVVTYVSKSTEESFVESYKGGNRIPGFVIHNCVDQNPGQTFGLTLEKTERYVLSVGRLTRQKNHRILIQALAESQYPGNLYIVGDGPLRTELEDLARSLDLEKRVIFKGVISNSSVLELLRGSDALLMPSLYEGMSNALLEAIVNRIYTIVSDVPAQREAVEVEGKLYGSLASVNCIEEWRDAMNKLPAGTCNDDVYFSLLSRYSPGKFCENFFKAADVAVQRFK